MARYDSAHGLPHLDLLGWDGEVVEKQWLPAKPLNEAFADAGADLNASWADYRERFLRRRP